MISCNHCEVNNNNSTSFAILLVNYGKEDSYMSKIAISFLVIIDYTTLKEYLLANYAKA